VLWPDPEVQIETRTMIYDFVFDMIIGFDKTETLNNKIRMFYFIFISNGDLMSMNVEAAKVKKLVAASTCLCLKCLRN
jgi:hypothetical protein